jgi:hypothetical protein
MTSTTSPMTTSSVFVSGLINRSAHNLFGATLCAILSVAACGSSSGSPASMPPTSPSPPASFSVSGRVLEVISGACCRRGLPGVRPRSVAQLYGAGLHGLVLGRAKDVEITSRSNRQPSLTMPPLRVSGQLFQITPAGRVGLSRGSLDLSLSLDASAQTTSTAFFLEVDADAKGNYLACGFPANWPIRFTSGYEDYQKWHQFGADGTLDIERRQP